jgi:hypothetical protein
LVIRRFLTSDKKIKNIFHFPFQFWLARGMYIKERQIGRARRPMGRSKKMEVDAYDGVNSDARERN